MHDDYKRTISTIMVEKNVSGSVFLPPVLVFTPQLLRIVGEFKVSRLPHIVILTMVCGR